MCVCALNCLDIFNKMWSSPAWTSPEPWVNSSKICSLISSWAHCLCFPNSSSPLVLSAFVHHFFFPLPGPRGDPDAGQQPLQLPVRCLLLWNSVIWADDRRAALLPHQQQRSGEEPSGDAPLLPMAHPLGPQKCRINTNANQLKWCFGTCFVSAVNVELNVPLSIDSAGTQKKKKILEMLLIYSLHSKILLYTFAVMGNSPFGVKCAAVTSGKIWSGAFYWGEKTQYLQPTLWILDMYLVFTKLSCYPAFEYWIFI